MPRWLNPETGETCEGCPHCETVRQECEVQIAAMERERRADRSARARAEAEVQREHAAKRDGAIWKRILSTWADTFPEHAKRLRSKGIKSARATAVFLRIEAGASVEDWEDAIMGARQLPYVTFGKRTATGTEHDLAVDLQQIAAPNRDHEFELLCEVGKAVRV